MHCYFRRSIIFKQIHLLAQTHRALFNYGCGELGHYLFTFSRTKLFSSLVLMTLFLPNISRPYFLDIGKCFAKRKATNTEQCVQSALNVIHTSHIKQGFDRLVRNRLQMACDERSIQSDPNWNHIEECLSNEPNSKTADQKLHLLLYRKVCFVSLQPIISTERLEEICSPRSLFF